MRSVRRLWLLVGVLFFGVLWAVWAATWVGFLGRAVALSGHGALREGALGEAAHLL
jgi:hypothetical protein